MKKKFNTSFQDYPENHPLYRIHRPLGGESRIVRILLLGLSIVTVAILLIPSMRLRRSWAWFLNVFTNHWENYRHYFKKTYNALILETALPLIYFVLLMPYALLTRLRGHKSAAARPENTSKDSARYQS